MKKKKKSSVGKVVCIILAVMIALVLLTALTGWLFVQSKLKKLNYVEPVATTEEIKINTELETVVVDEETGDTYTYDTLVEEVPELPEPKEEAPVKEQNIINILLIGSDARMKGTTDPGRADVTMLVSLNKDTGSVKLISFERGIYVPIPGMVSDLLTHSFHWGGAELTSSCISECFLLDLDGYMHVDFAAFRSVIDALGGVDVELTDAEAYAINSGGGGTMVLHKGMNHLDGVMALRFCRLRSIDSNWQRIRRQRDVMQAVINKASSMSLLEINSVANTILPMINTNLSTEKLSSLLLSAPKFIGAHAEQYQVPEQNNSAKISFQYEADRLQGIIYGE